MKKYHFYRLVFLVVAAALLFGVLFECVKNKERIHTNTSVAQAPGPSALIMSAVRIDANGLLTSQERDAMAEQLSGNDGFAHDVVFLIAGSVRERCSAAHAHELAQMAVQAHLPALSGISAVLDKHPELRPRLYAVVRHLAAIAPCNRVVDIVIGRYRMHLDVEAYAAAFPDSYFDPSLSSLPMDFSGRDLATRVADPCTPIIYGVLPLGVEGPWQCISLRANARKHLAIDTCGAILSEAAKHSTNALQSMDIQRSMAIDIHESLEKLPAMCR